LPPTCSVCCPYRLRDEPFRLRQGDLHCWTFGSTKGKFMESFGNTDSASRRDQWNGGSGLRRLLAAMRCFGDLGGQMEIQRMMTFLLVARSPNRKVSMAELRELTGMSNAGSTRNSYYWERIGFVQIEEDSDDHRERVVSLTAMGRRFAARLEEACQ